MATSKTEVGSRSPRKLHFDLERGDSSSRDRSPSANPKPKPIQRSNSLPYASPDLSTVETRVEDDADAGEFRLEDLSIDVPHLLDTLDSHVKFRVKEGYEMKNLPKFDDLTRYDIREKDELELWRLEVRRLADAAQSPEPPSLEGDPDWFGTADAEGYNRLHRLALQAHYALDICIHDNELVMLEHQPQIANEKLYEVTHKRICRTFDQEQGCVRYERPIRIEGDYNDEAYHALVNYITAVLVRLLLRSMSGQLWVDGCISTVAKFAAKFKVLGADLPRAFEKTLDAYRDFQIRMSQAPEARGGFPIAPSSGGAAGDEDEYIAKQQNALKDGIDTSGARYFMEMDTFRYSLSILMRSAIADLVWNEETVQTADVFETSSIVYDTGFPNRRTQLCHERDGSIGAAANRADIDFAGVAFQAGYEVWSTMAPLPPVSEKDHYTTVTWSRKPLLTQASRQAGSAPAQDRRSLELAASIRLTGMKDVITAMIPYLMYCGAFASNISQFAKSAILLSDPSYPVRYYRQRAFITVARIHTSAYETERKKSHAPLVAQTVFETDIAKLARKGLPNEQLGDELEQVLRWTIDEKAIIIQHTWYSLISLGACALLIGGGVAFIAMGDRAKGVDPSNLTALAWAAAGFIMVYFKSRRVQDWPWRDFLRGRIVCRSISEVHSVTGMDSQTLAAILLRLQSRVLLHTRGPFNTLFSRKAEDGFSIDVPMLTSTVVNGGFIFVRVDSMSGPALVALRVSNWGSYDSISPKDISPDGEGFICRDFLDPGRYPIEKRDGETGEKSLPLYTLCANELHWFRVRGIFATQAVFD